LGGIKKKKILRIYLWSRTIKYYITKVKPWFFI
jgi:hypothetical protein